MKINKSDLTRSTFPLLTLLASALIIPTTASASASQYPQLPDLPGADVRGQARVLVYLDQEGSLVEVDGVIYSLGGRPLELAFDDLELITLLFVVPDGAGLFVTEDGVWTADLQPSTSSRMLAYDLFDTVPEPGEFGFEVALPGQPAPTVPDLVIRPTDDDPDPS